MQKNLDSMLKDLYTTTYYTFCLVTCLVFLQEYGNLPSILPHFQSMPKITATTGKNPATAIPEMESALKMIKKVCWGVFLLTIYIVPWHVWCFHKSLKPRPTPDTYHPISNPRLNCGNQTKHVDPRGVPRDSPKPGKTTSVLGQSQQDQSIYSDTRETMKSLS